MFKFQVPSLNGVGCGDDTNIHTNRHIQYSHGPNTKEMYFTSRIRNLTLLRGLDSFGSKISGFQYFVIP